MMAPDALYDLWKSGFVNRWHTHPHPGLRNGQDLTSAHSHRVAILVTLIAADNDAITQEEMLQCVMAALFHDSDEVATGDMAYPAKKAMPDVADKLVEFGKQWMQDRMIPAFPTPPLLKMCDRLDAYLFMLINAHDLRDNPKWRDMKEAILDDCTDLGCFQLVNSLMNYATDREWF